MALVNSEKLSYFLEKYIKKEDMGKNYILFFIVQEMFSYFQGTRFDDNEEEYYFCK